MKSLHACVGLAAIGASLILGPVAAGQGTIAGPKLAPDPLPFETLSSFVRTTSRLMPPYRETVLPEGDLADIYAYLQSIPKAPDYKSLPLLAQ